LVLIRLSEEIHVPLSNGRIISSRYFGIIEIVPLPIFLDMTYVVADMGAGTEMHDEAVEVVDALSVVFVRGLASEVSHLVVAVRVFHVTEQPLCCSVWVVVASFQGLSHPFLWEVQASSQNFNHFL